MVGKLQLLLRSVCPSIHLSISLSPHLPIFLPKHPFRRRLLKATSRALSGCCLLCHPVPARFMAIIKCLWLVQQLIFQGLFLPSEGSGEKNLSAGEIKPFFFRGEKWSNRLSALKCYSGFQMSEELVCIVMRPERGLESL